MTVSKEEATITGSTLEDLAGFGFSSIVEIGLREYESMQSMGHARFSEAFFPILMNRVGEPARSTLPPETKVKLFDMAENMIPAIENFDLLEQLIDLKRGMDRNPSDEASADRFDVVDRISGYARVAMRCKKSVN